MWLVEIVASMAPPASLELVVLAARAQRAVSSWTLKCMIYDTFRIHQQQVQAVVPETQALQSPEEVAQQIVLDMGGSPEAIAAAECLLERRLHPTRLYENEAVGGFIGDRQR